MTDNKTDFDKVKADIDKTSKALNEKLTTLTDNAKEHSEKLDGFEKKLDEIHGKQKADPSVNNDELKKEMADIAEKHEADTKLLNTTMEDMKSIKEQLEELDIQTQKTSAPFVVEDAIRKVCEENKEKFKEFNGGAKNSVVISLPQPDLRQKANVTLASLQNETIDRDRIAGIFFDPDRANHIRAFMNVTPTSTDVIRFVKETAFTDNAGTTAEGAAALQTDFTLNSQDETIRKINTYLKVTKESMADANFLENFIRVRVMSKIMSKEDTQILTGNNVAPNLNGLKGQAASYVDKIADSAATNFDVIANAATNVAVNGNGGYAANLALVHPNDFLAKFITAKDANSAYFLPHIFSPIPLEIGGARVIANTAVTEGDFFVGDFRLGATFALRSDIEVSFTNTDQDDFIKGLVTILVEERVALVVYRPNAFIFSTFADALGEATA